MIFGINLNIALNWMLECRQITCNMISDNEQCHDYDIISNCLRIDLKYNTKILNTCDIYSDISIIQIDYYKNISPVYSIPFDGIENNIVTEEWYFQQSLIKDLTKISIEDIQLMLDIRKLLKN